MWKDRNLVFFLFSKQNNKYFLKKLKLFKYGKVNCDSKHRHFFHSLNINKTQNVCLRKLDDSKQNKKILTKFYLPHIQTNISF